ncbi:MAG TPA: alpha/beta fold hydrolase [Candidatus Eisenbacteria bacterium]|nr:alpha/beta fold hydrolase [Candidatus Eisenbacteria bacterium]
MTTYLMQVHHDSQALFLDGPAGRLEAILWTPTRAGAPPLAAMVCHPHPLFGGTMHNKVVYNAAKTMDALGIPVLRFNFRGTGRSAGEHDKGRGEQDDAQAALEFLAAQFPGTPLLMAGFSFGSVVGLRVGCRDSRVTELIGMGIPVNSTDFSFLSECAKPKLFVHGAEDQFGAKKKVEEVVAELPGEDRLVVVEGADHFFAGHLDEFNAAISSWLRNRHAGLHIL